ncbi:MAG: DUF3999 family protein [Caldimonas sp.]
MQRSEPVIRWLVLIAAAAALPYAGIAAAAEPRPYRYEAPIEIAKPAAFVELALPPGVYAHTMQGDLRDLRVVDARGERVPFALLAPQAVPAVSERVREATLYPLPQRPVGAAVWPSPVEVTVEGDRISVRRSGRLAAPSAAALRESPGWLIDLGEATPGDAAAIRLQLRWSGPAEFSAAYAIETSADLRSWRAGPGGQLMALQSVTGALTQPTVALPDGAGRFVRLTWLDPAASPVLTGAAAIAPAREVVASDAATELVFAPSAEPAGQRGAASEARGSLFFDLGGDLPLVDVDLRFASGTRVAPVRVQGRNRAGDPWQELGGGVFYRLERDGTVAESPAVAMRLHARFLRIVPDERAAALDPQQTRLVVRVHLASLVFASSGDAPFRLLAGSPDARVGALPAGTLVPQFDEERKRFGRATLGAFGESPGVALAAEQSEREARLRPWLLWGVLVAGVIGLAVLVWRLARSGPGAAPPAA